MDAHLGSLQLLVNNSHSGPCRSCSEGSALGEGGWDGCTDPVAITNTWVVVFIQLVLLLLIPVQRLQLRQNLEQDHPAG